MNALVSVGATDVLGVPMFLGCRFVLQAISTSLWRFFRASDSQHRILLGIVGSFADVDTVYVGERSTVSRLLVGEECRAARV